MIQLIEDKEYKLNYLKTIQCAKEKIVIIIQDYQNHLDLINHYKSFKKYQLLDKSKVF